jgi:hypothetical protein
MEMRGGDDDGGGDGGGEEEEDGGGGENIKGDEFIYIICICTYMHLDGGVELDVLSGGSELVHA